MASEQGLPAQSLLSLLNFSQPASTNNGESAVDNTTKPYAEEDASTIPPQLSSHAPTTSASDLVARFMDSRVSPAVSAKSEEKTPRQYGTGSGAAENGVVDNSATASQDALLRLLSRTTTSAARAQNAASRPTTNPGAGNKAHNVSTPDKLGISGRQISPITTFGSAQSRDPTPVEAIESDNAGKQKENKPLFTYRNPFEALNASRKQSPSTENLAGLAAIPQAAFSDLSIRQSPESSSATTSTRKKLTPKLPSRVPSTVEKAPDELQSVQNPSEQDLHLQSAFRKTSEATFPATQEETGHELREDVGNVPNGTSEPVRASRRDHNEEPPNEDARAVGMLDGAVEATEQVGNPTSHDTPRNVPVYNFPIKPFVAITIKTGPPSNVGIREDGVMEISRLKKEFDQIDRTLATATSKYIAYALLRSGGIRLIRQSDGSDRQVFKHSHDRVFNVTFCSTAMISPPSDDQAVLGTAISGAVYYATISKRGNDLFEENALDTESLIFPPYPVGDENTAGGLLKTRARRSSRHPEFFAIGRGKSIHLIWPAAVLTSKYGVTSTNRQVDIEKFYKEQGLKITTGKAGKDFSFSEDDTVIVSLDKAGRLRFWAIGPLIAVMDAATTDVKPTTINLPLLTLSTASPTEKSWPTSVLFVDKARPYNKCGALRYVLVGLRQNHTLQLWDIALGKAVQELNFPHETETDGICSVAYHPSSGIIVVGHPTRNSIYFIHLSAPRYTLQGMTQASFIERVAHRDSSFPKPDSTACMSGIREISFEDRGQLRSIELLPIYKNDETNKNTTEGLFELYVVHSKGVTCLNIGKEDLGWDADNKILMPVDATAEGIITLEELRLGSVLEEPTDVTINQEEVQQPIKPGKKKSATKAVRVSEPLQISGADQDDGEVRGTDKGANDVAPVSASGDDPPNLPRDTKKTKKKSANPITGNTMKGAAETASFAPSPKPLEEPTSDVDQSTQNVSSSDVAQSLPSASRKSTNAQAQANTVSIPGDWLDKELKKIEKGVGVEIRKELDALYQNIHNDRDAQDLKAVDRHEAVLRLVSSSLSDNVEKNLSRIISTEVQHSVIPVITTVTHQAIVEQVGEALSKALHETLPQEIHMKIPIALQQALRDPEMLRNISDPIRQAISSQIQGQVSELLQSPIATSHSAIAIAAAEKAASEVEGRLIGRVLQLEANRRSDLIEIDKFGRVLHGMAETLQTMSETQVAFQGQILKHRRSNAQSVDTEDPAGHQQVSTARYSPRPASAPSKEDTTQNFEYEEINRLMTEGRYEEGSIKWLQSTHPVELFDRLFVRFTAEYLHTDVSPLVAFSIAITVANSLRTNTIRRLEWMDAAFAAVDLHDPEIADLSGHAPALLTSVIQKLEGLHDEVVLDQPQNPILQIIARVNAKAKNMRALLLGHRFDGPNEPKTG